MGLEGLAHESGTYSPDPEYVRRLQLYEERVLIYPIVVNPTLSV